MGSERSMGGSAGDIGAAVSASWGGLAGSPRHAGTRRRSLAGSLVVSASLVLGTLAALADQARAAFPGRDGKIAFAWNYGFSMTPESCGDVFTINPDGSNRQRLTTSCFGVSNDEPAFSADGRRITFEGANGHIFVMSDDGSHRGEVTNPARVGGDQPAFAPSGKKIVFSGAGQSDHRSRIFTVNVGGSHLRALTDASHYNLYPVFSPSGQELAFTRQDTGPDGYPVDNIYTMHRNGSHVRRLTHAPKDFADTDADFSPNGKRIAFTCAPPGTNFDYDPEVCVMRADGRHLRHLTLPGSTNFHAADPAFSPSGTQIAFVGANGTLNDSARTVTLYTMHSDGSHLHSVTQLDNPYSNDPSTVTPSWQPR